MKNCKINSNSKIINSIIANNSEIIEKTDEEKEKIFLLEETIAKSPVFVSLPLVYL